MAVYDVSVNVQAGKSADVDAAVAAAAGLKLMGYTAFSVAGAQFEIIHGATGNGGTVLAYVGAAANVSKEAWFGPDGLPCANGLSVNQVGGTWSLTLYYKTAP